MEEQLISVVDAFKTGDKSAFEEIYWRTYEYVYFRAKACAKSEQDVEEIIKETYVELIKGVKKFKESEMLFDWIGKTVYRNGSELHRNKDRMLLSKVEEENAFAELENDNISPESAESSVDDETKKFVAEIIEGLPELQKIVIYAYYFDGISVVSLSELQACKETVVKQRLSCGIITLKKQLQMVEKSGYRLQPLSGKVLWHAINMLSEKTVFSIVAAKKLYAEIQKEVGFVGYVKKTAESVSDVTDTVTSVTDAVTGVKDAVTGVSEAVTVVKSGVEAAGLGAKIASLSTGMKAVIVAGALAVTGGGVGGVAYIANNAQEPTTEAVMNESTVADDIEVTTTVAQTTEYLTELIGTSLPAECFTYERSGNYYLCTGFSEKGYEEYLKSKDDEEFRLILPTEDTEGNKITGFKFKNSFSVDIADLKANLCIVCPDSYTYFNSGSHSDTYYRRILKRVELGDGITSISGDAFKDCTSLESVVFGDGLKSIGIDAFYNCAKLKSIVIPNSVTTIHWNAFAYCSGLESVVIGSGVSSVEGNVFEKCTGLKTVEIRDGASVIGNNMFGGCTSLESILIPSSVKVVGSDAFINCGKLLEVSLLGVETIGYNAFEGCVSMEKAELGDGLKSIGIATFYNCAKLKSIVIPDNVTSIESKAFSGCASMEKAELGEGVKTIGSDAFYKCTKLKNIVIPDNVTSIGMDAFRYCKELESVVVGSGVTKIESNVFGNCSGLKSVEIKEGVTYVGYYMFTGCTELESVSIPASVKKIEREGFSYCSKLLEISLPGVEEVGLDAFDGCVSMEKVELSENLKTIGTSAFSGCTQLKSIEISNNVTSIGVLAFNGCPNLVIITPSGSVADVYAKNNNIKVSN